MTPRRLPANINVAPNSPIPRANARAAPEPRPAAASGSATRDERPPRSGAERARSLRHRRIEALERRDRGADVERAGNERDRDDHRRLRERELGPDHVDVAADEADTAEGGEQSDAGDGRRQDERKLDQCHGDVPEAAGPGRDQPRGRRPGDDDQRERDDVGLDRDEQRVGRLAPAERGDEIAGRNTGEDRDDRQQEEEQRDPGRDGDPEREEAVHGLPNPARASAAWPCFPSTRFSQARAAGFCEEDETTAIS